MALMKFFSAWFAGDVVGQQAAALEVVQRLDGEIRIDGAGAVSDEQCEVHDFARLAALDDERDLGARLLLDEPVVHGSHGEQTGDRSVGGVDSAVGDDEQRVSGCDGVCGACTQLIERIAKAGFAIFRAEECRQRGRKQIAGRDAAQLFQISIGQDGMRQLEGVAVLGGLVEDVALGADVADERHDELFANGIDGRVGDLREELLEVVEERLRTVREAGQRRVGAHGADRLFAACAHRAEQDAQIFFAVAVGALAAQQRLRIGRDDARRLGQGIERDLLLLEPLGVGLAGGEALLDFGVGDDALLHGVDQEHATGLQAALLADVLGGHVEDAGFRGEDDEIVLGDDVAAGAQTVAVERGADDAAVGEGNGCRPVPWFHQRCVVLVERALVLVHVGIAGPGFGDEHRHDVGKRTAGLEEKFDGVIERRGVAAIGRDHGEEFLDLVAVQRAVEHRLARVHPTDVAANGVDFAVVGNVAVGMRELPTGKGVGGEALVNEAESAGDQRIGQFEVELLNLRGQHEALVDDGATGEGGDVEIVLAFDVGGGHFVFGAAADKIQGPLESIFVHAIGAADEELLDVRLRGAGFAADGIAVHGCVAPAEDLEALRQRRCARRRLRIADGCAGRRAEKPWRRRKRRVREVECPVRRTRAQKRHGGSGSECPRHRPSRDRSPRLRDG